MVPGGQWGPTPSRAHSGPRGWGLSGSGSGSIGLGSQGPLVVPGGEGLRGQLWSQGMGVSVGPVVVQGGGGSGAGSGPRRLGSQWAR